MRPESSKIVNFNVDWAMNECNALSDFMADSK
jgi:hypothetical protein